MWIAGLIGLTSVAGCGPPPDEAVRGRWAVDVDAWLADPTLAALPRPAAESAAESAAAQARAMAARAVFVLEPGHCSRVVAGRAERLPCRFEREDRGVIVLRVERPDGAPDFVRARPTERGLALTWGGYTLPLRRVTEPAAEGRAPPAP